MTRKFIKTGWVLALLFFVYTDVSGQPYPEEKLGWKLGAQTFTFKYYTFFEALDKAASCGVRYVEAYPRQPLGGGLEGVMDYKMDAAKRKAILKQVRSKGMKIEAFGVIRISGEAEWKQLFAFAKAMGIKNINTEPKEEDLAVIGRLADRYKIRVSFHNHPKPRQYWNPDMVLSAIQKADSKYVGACPDIGHWIRSGLDPVASLRKLEGHIQHLHFKDLNEAGVLQAHDVHWGTGVAGVKAILQELRRQQFKGMLSAEYEYNWEDNVPDVTASIRNFRKMLEKLP